MTLIPFLRCMHQKLGFSRPPPLTFPAPSIATSRNTHPRQPYHSNPIIRTWHLRFPKGTAINITPAAADALAIPAAARGSFHLQFSISFRATSAIFPYSPAAIQSLLTSDPLAAIPTHPALR